jgi:hypothetical protein
MLFRMPRPLRGLSRAILGPPPTGAWGVRIGSPADSSLRDVQGCTNAAKHMDVQERLSRVLGGWRMGHTYPFGA